MCVTWRIHICDMTPSSALCVGPSVCVTWLIHIWGMTHSYVWHASFTCVTWFIHMCDMTHSYEWHDLVIDIEEQYAWPFQIQFGRMFQKSTSIVILHEKLSDEPTCEKFCLQTHLPTHLSRCWQPSLTRVTRGPLGMCDVSYSCVWHASFICVKWLIHMCDMPHSCVWNDLGMCDVSYSCVWHASFMCVKWLKYVWRELLICVTCLIHVCEMT